MNTVAESLRAIEAAPAVAALPAIHPVTLSFSDAALERDFRDEYVRRMIPITRFNLTLSALLLSAFGLVGPELMPGATHQALLIRYGIMVPFNLAVLAWSFTGGFARWWGLLLCLGSLVVGLGDITMYSLASHEGKEVFYAGFLLILAYVLVLLRLRFVQVAPVAIILAAVRIAVTFSEGWLSQTAVVSAIANVVGIVVIGLVAAYVLERQMRTEFLARLTVKQRSAQLDTALTAAHTAQRRAEHLAWHDPLTDLFNRRYFRDAAHRELERRRAGDSPLTVAVIDIDHFKRINDRHGHAAGDHVITAVAGVLRAGVRDGDIVCRYGGEEFAVLLHDCDQTCAVQTGERIRRDVEEMRVSGNGASIGVTISLGIAVLEPGSGDTIDALLERADQALYRAKESGRNRTVLADAPAATLPSGPDLPQM